jgi:hypothetical protein
MSLMRRRSAGQPIGSPTVPSRALHAALRGSCPSRTEDARPPTGLPDDSADAETASQIERLSKLPHASSNPASPLWGASCG